MQEIRYILIDDIDGSDAVETIRFTVGKRSYEMDLNEKHASEFKSDMEKWTKHARKPKDAAPRASRRARGAAEHTSDAATIRAWAIGKGIALGPRGRIPADIREDYYAANPGARP